jgi:poly(A) polymerase
LIPAKGILGDRMSSKSNKDSFYEITSAAAKICKELDTSCYLVGGVVRKLLVERKIDEIDILVESSGAAAKLADKLSSAFPEASKPVDLGGEFSTKEFRIGEFIIQITEAEENDSLPISSLYVPISDKLKADVLRRDFTINTLLIPIDNPTVEAIIDPLSIGMADFKTKILRTPLDAAVTLGSDPIRLIRLVRFMVQFGYNINDELELTVRRNAGKIADEPGERISAELTKILTCEKADYGILLLKQFGLLHFIMPEVSQMATINHSAEYYDDDLLTHSLKVMKNVDPVPQMRFSALMHDVGKVTTKKLVDGIVTFPGHQHASAKVTETLLKKLRYPNKLIAGVCKLIDMHMVAYRDEWSDTAVRRLVHDAGDQLDNLLLIYRADILARKPPHNSLALLESLLERIKLLDLDAIVNARSPLCGEEIMEILNLPQGPEIGEIQHSLEQAIIDGILEAEADAAREYLIKEIAPKYRG